MLQGCGRCEGLVILLWLEDGAQRHQHESTHSCPCPFSVARGGRELMVACHHEGWNRRCSIVSLGAPQEGLAGMCLSPLVSLSLSHLPAALPSSTLLTKMPSPCSEPPRTLKPSLPSMLFSTVMALMTLLSLLLAVGTERVTWAASK